MTYEETYKYLQEGRKALVAYSTKDGYIADEPCVILSRELFQPHFVMLNETPLMLNLDYGFCTVELTRKEKYGEIDFDREFEDLVPLFTQDEIEELGEQRHCRYLEEYGLYEVIETDG